MFFTTNPPTPDQIDPELVQILTELDAGKRSAVDVARFSDVDRLNAVGIMPLIRALPVDARRFLVRQMLEQSETNLQLNFSRVLHHLLDDSDDEVRVLAIQGLWEDENSLFADRLLNMLTTEFESAVREAIVVSLGRFGYLAATGSLDESRSNQIRSTLLEVFQSSDQIAVRRRALESLAYFSDTEVEEAISEAYDSILHDLRISAIFSMGRNLSLRWLPTVLELLQDSDPEVRFEAARVSGEFGDERAVTQLLDLIHDEDPEVQTAAVSALGQIGGKVAVGALRQLARSDDLVLGDAAQDALSQAMTVNDPMRLSPS